MSTARRGGLCRGRSCPGTRSRPWVPIPGQRSETGRPETHAAPACPTPVSHQRVTTSFYMYT
eukprot:scaffold172440_cov38-Prasinocladus_malaysianus.AAC.1